MHTDDNRPKAGLTSRPVDEERERVLIRIAAECHREKWRFGTDTDEPRKGDDIRKEAFDVLHRIGDMANNAARSCPEIGNPDVSAMVGRLNALADKLNTMSPTGVLLVRQAAALITEMEGKRQACERCYAEEQAIVNRIWALFGSPSYAELKGRSIYDLIMDLQSKLASVEAERDGMREACAKVAEHFRERTGSHLAAGAALEIASRIRSLTKDGK